MITRCRSPPLSVGERPRGQLARARGLERVHRAADVVRALDLERAETRIASHQHDLEHRVVEREVRVLRHDRDAACEAVP